MMKFFISTAATGLLLLSTTSVSLATGDYYEGASRQSHRLAPDRIQTGSTSYGYSSGGQMLFGNTSRDNRKIDDTVHLDSGDYYEGASRPR